MKYKNLYQSLSTAKKAGIWFTIINLINSGLNILSTPLFTRILSESDIGAYSVYNTWYSLFSVVITLNLSAGIYEVLLVEKSHDKDNVTYSLMVLTLLLCVFWTIPAIVFQDAVRSLLDMPIRYAYMMLIEILANAVVAFYITRKRFEYSYKDCVVISLPLAFIRIIVSLCFVLFLPGDKVFLRILGNVGTLSVFAICLCVILCRKKINKSPTRYWGVGVKNNIVLLPHYISGILLASSDRVMISRIIGSDKAGIYSIIYSFSFLVSILFNAVISVFTPYCYNALKNEDHDALKKTSHKLVLTVAILCALVIAVAPEAIRIFAPASYYEAVDIVPVLVIGAYLTFLYGMFSCVEFYYHKSYYTTIATFVGAAVNIGLNLALMPFAGYKVAAYTTLIGYLMMAIGHYFVAYKILKKDVFSIRWIILAIVAELCFAAVMVSLYSWWLIRYIIVALIIFYIALNRKKMYK